jgi:hypothetical protein
MNFVHFYVKNTTLKIQLGRIKILAGQKYGSYRRAECLYQNISTSMRQSFHPQMLESYVLLTELHLQEITAH